MAFTNGKNYILQICKTKSCSKEFMHNTEMSENSLFLTTSLSIFFYVFFLFTDDIDSSSTLSRSKTMPALMRPKLTRKITNLGNSDRLKNAKELAEKAIKVGL